MKQCSKCSKHKAMSHFSKSVRGLDGLASICKPCHSKKQKMWRIANPDKVLAYQKKNREKLRASSRAYQRNNRARVSEYNATYNKKNWQKKLVATARCRARRNGLEFNLTLGGLDWPDKCPVLGHVFVPAQGKCMPNTPTLDRIDNTKGYTLENTRVISWRANLLKRDATLDELQKITAWVADTLSQPNKVDSASVSQIRLTQTSEE